MKKIFFIILLSLFCQNVFAYDFYRWTGDCYLYYDYNDGVYGNSVTVVDGTSLTANLTIPNQVYNNGRYYSVTAIGGYAFSDDTMLTSVTIPSSVTSIGERAFYQCTGILSVTIPSSVTSIGVLAFGYCTGISSVTIPTSVTSIGHSAFYGCTGLTLVNFNAINCVSTIATSTPAIFGGCRISTFNFGSSVTRVPSYLCYGLSWLTSVSLPNSLSVIGASAFYGCTGLTSITIPPSVTSIGNSAFQNCSGLTTLNFNAISCSFSESSNLVFSGSTNITTVNFGNSVTTIPHHLCYGFSGLTSLSIPDSVTNIGSYAFCNCTQLTSVSIPHLITSIGNSAFFGCTGLSFVEFNADSCLYMGNDADNRVFKYTDIRAINIGNNVKYIPAYAFYGCYHLSSITIPNLVDGIGVQAFSGCSSLDTVYLYPIVPPSVGSNTFSSSVHHFNVRCDAYTAYYSSTQWLTYRSCLRSHFYPNIEVTVSSSNPTHGTAVKVVQGGRYVSCDSLCIIIATSNYGYHFDHWSNGRMSNPDTLYLTGDSNVVAYFAPNQYAVYGVPNYPDRGYVLGNDTVDYLDTVVLTAVANHGYMFDHWSDGAYENPHTVVANGNRTITAYFVPAQFSLSVISSDLNMGTVSGGGNYNYQSNRTIHAFANTGYHFTQWNDGDINSSRTITLTQDTAFVAYFAPNQYAVCGVPNYPDRGYVLGNDTVDYLDTVVLTAVANHGYTFDHWGDGAYENPHTVVANGNRTITAFFVPAQFSLSVISSDLNMGTVSGGGNYDYQSNRIIRAIANTGYHFTYWNDGDANNNRTITLTQDTSFTAYFAPSQYTLTLRSADESLGIVTGGGEYDYLDTVTITATAIAPHYHFERWSDNNTDNPRQYVITGNATLTAYFALDVHTVVVQVDDMAHGTVSGGGNYAYGSAATITAETPFSGWVFSHWSDGATYNPYTFAVLQDTVMTAYFVREGSQNGVDGVDTMSAKIYDNNGQIVVEGAEGYPVYLYDVVGRLLATRRETAQKELLDVPASGAYLVKIGDAPARRIVVRR